MMPIRILSGHQSSAAIHGSFRLFHLRQSSCRAAPLSIRARPFTARTQTLRRVCPRHFGVVRLRHTHRRSLSPSRSPHPARRCRLLSASLCPVCNCPRHRSIPLWSALVRSCSLCLHFNDTTCHLNQQREQLVNHNVCGLLSHQNSNQATDSGTRMAYGVKKAC